MNEKLLERIVVALEGINEKLDIIGSCIDGNSETILELKNLLEDCATEDSQGKLFRICASVYKL